MMIPIFVLPYSQEEKGLSNVSVFSLYHVKHLALPFEEAYFTFKILNTSWVFRVLKILRILFQIYVSNEIHSLQYYDSFP